MNDPRPRSLFFFTFHKCASVFFSRSVLQQAQGLEHVDYAGRMFVDAEATPSGFAPLGRLYGPLRLSAQGDVLERVVAPALESVRLDDLPACLMVRDPRDMLVSLFFHNRDGQPIRPDLPGGRKKEQERADAVRLGIDGYVLERAARFQAGYDRALQLVRDRPTATVLRYEDMIDDWAAFSERLQTVFSLSAEAVQAIKAGSRPNAVEQPGAHKRSGATGDHRRKLTDQTVEALNGRFGPFLETFGYRPA